MIKSARAELANIADDATSDRKAKLRSRFLMTRDSDDVGQDSEERDSRRPKALISGQIAIIPTGMRITISLSLGGQSSRVDMHSRPCTHDIFSTPPWRGLSSFPVERPRQGKTNMETQDIDKFISELRAGNGSATELVRWYEPYLGGKGDSGGEKGTVLYTVDEWIIWEVSDSLH